MHRTHMARQYVRRLTPERRALFEEKVLAEQLFKGWFSFGMILLIV